MAKDDKIRVLEDAGVTEHPVALVPSMSDSSQVDTRTVTFSSSAHSSVTLWLKLFA